MTREQIGQILIALLEYLPAGMTIAFSAFIVLRSQTTQMRTDDLLLWILSLVGLLATATLVERLGDIRRIEKFTESTYEYLVKNERKPPIDLVFTDRKSLAPLETRLQSAQEIAISGGSLFRVVNEYLGYLERKAREGCILKFLLVDPECEAAKMLAKYVVYEIDDFENYKSQLLASLANLHRLELRYPNLIEIRTCLFVPPMSLLMTDSKKENGTILVEMYSLRVPTRDRPEFTLKQSQEPYWFSFFKNQFDHMWDLSNRWSPKPESVTENS